LNVQPFNRADDVKNAFARLCLLSVLCAGLFSCHSLKTTGAPENPAVDKYRSDFDESISSNSNALWKEGRETFRNESFGSEDFWGGKLRLHEIFNGEKHGGSGPGVTPRQALDLGLKVDVGRLPGILLAAMEGGRVSLDEPTTTLELLKADAVVGVKAVFKDDKDNMRISSIGITCALCHSTVNSALQKGIGSRLDGWPNRDLNIGEIAAMAPNLKPFEEVLNIDNATLIKALRAWGPGRYDAQLIHDGKAFRPDGKTAATVLPAAFGLSGINLHTYTGWGSVTHWNAYVAITQMHGKGTFFDPRLNDKERFPIAVRSGMWNVRDTVDLVTPRLSALHFYQLSIPAPKPEKDTYDKNLAKKGESVFAGKAQCARCHVPPLFTEPGWPMHTAAEIGIDDFQASRSPDRKYYRTTPLAGLFVRMKGGFYHDGRFPTLGDVVNHYDKTLKLNLTESERIEIIEYLKSL
jgi:hypothetical protein